MTTSAQSQSIRRVVLVTDALGVAAAALVVALSARLWGDLEPLVPSSPAVVAVCVALTVLGQLAYVKVRHGATTEELNFFEVLLAASILVLAPEVAFFAILTGVLVGELVIRRPAIKVAFNLGMYAVSTAAMVITYHLLRTELFDAAGQSPLSAVSMVSLIVGSIAFTAVNLLILARLIHVTAGAGIRDVVSEEWRLSAFMAVGSVGVGAVLVALATEGFWSVVPFAFLPALALWYAYGASAQHAEARERNRFLVQLGGLLAQHGQESTALRDATEAIRQIVGAPESAILDPSTAADAVSIGVLQSVAGNPGPRALLPEELPVGWRTGVVTRLDLGTGEPGALLLGSTDQYRPSRITGRTRGWSLEEADAPVLGALVAAVGSAMRAGAAFATLTEERDKLTAVVDNTSDGIAMIDDSGRIRLWSQTMARMTGVSTDDLTYDLAGSPAIVTALVEAARRGGTFAGAPPVQASLVRADGEALDVSVTTTRVREATTGTDSADQGWVSILTVHDETRERRVERMKTDFVATVSHELRTPITPIKGYAHLLATRRDRMAPEKVTEKLMLIASSADHLQRLVDDLLMVQKVSGTANLRIEMGVEDLADVVRQAVDAVPEMAERITLRLPEAPVEVQCDRERAVQCLVNLIGNAQKYAPDSPVEITASVVGLHAQVHVRDHGSGIPAAERDKVFERFYRREDPFTMRTGGAGLGLHIARELAVAMGGGLTLESPGDGVGSDFVLHLPTTQAPAVEPPHDPDQRVAAVSEIRPGQAWRSPRSGREHGARADTGSNAGVGDGEPTGDGTMDPSPDRRAAI